MAPKISCSELKKLQVKRRKLMGNGYQPRQPMEPLPSLASSISNSHESGNSKENSQPVNPFAKKTMPTDTTAIEMLNSSFTTSILNPASSTGDFFEMDSFIVGLEKKPSFVGNNEDDLEERLDEEKNNNNETSHQILGIEKSLKTSVIIESQEDLAFWQRELCNPEAIQRIMHSWNESNIQLYYRYPDSTLPAHQKKLIHKALNFSASKASTAKSDETLLWYRQFSENWRKALLSAFEGLKLGTLDSFYFLQEGMSVLFEKTRNGLKAYMKLSSLALADDFKANGITYKFIQVGKQVPEEIEDKLKTTNPDPDADDSADSEADSEIDDKPESQQCLQSEAKIQIKSAPIKFEKKDIFLEGTLALAELVDYLINQKDRNSFAILPEIYAPGPFVYGTLCRNEFTSSGACRAVQGTTVYQLRMSGIIFPRNLVNFLRILGPGRIFQLAQERQPLSDFFAIYPVEQE